MALAPTDVSDAELKRLDAQGFCGVRFNFMKHLGAGANPEAVIALSKRLAPLGWHLQIHFHGDMVHELAPVLKRSAVPVVIDHQGRIDVAQGIDGPDFRAPARTDARSQLSRQGQWLRAQLETATALAGCRGVRQKTGGRVWRPLLLGGTDWPHPNLNAIPDDGTLTDLLGEIAPTAAALQAILVDNPARFYRFTPQ